MAGGGVELNDMTFVVLMSSDTFWLSASVTTSMPMENGRFVTSTRVLNSPRARNPEAGKTTLLVAAKYVPVV